MKVIKSGNDREGWFHEYVCIDGCGAILLVEESDLFLIASPSNYLEGDTVDRITFECPECHVHTSISGWGVPSALRARLKVRCPQ